MNTPMKVIFVAAACCSSTLSAETLFLDVYLNSVLVNELVEFDHTNDHFWSTDKVLDNSPLSDYASGLTGKVDYCGLQRISCKYSYETQRLYLTADSDMFPTQIISNKRESMLPITKSRGALLNYDIYYRDYESGTATTDILQQWRAFSEVGIFETTANLRKEWNSKNNNAVSEGVTRYDSFWQYNDEKKMRYWRVGDMISGGSSWARQVRMGGIKLSRRFELNPKFVSYPYPEFIGSAVLPSDVEVFINNYKMFNGNVEPGKFVIDSEPKINGFASASIITTDINGQAVTRDLQFYVAPELLREGVYDYDLNLGVLRQNFGIRSFDYDSNLTGIADVRYGLTNSITLSSHLELNEGIYNLGIGTDFTFANVGVFSFALSHGKDSANSGWLGSAGYRFQADNWGFSAQVKQQQSGYRDIGTTQFVLPIKREAQANAAYSFGNGVSLGIGYFDIEKFDNDNRQLVSGFYNQSLGSSSLSASANFDLNTKDVSLGLNLSIPFGQRSRASISHVHNNRSENRTVASASISRIGNRGFKGSMSNVVGSSELSANGSWRTDKIELSSGYYNRGGSSGYWGQLSGSLVLSKNSVLMGNRIADTFAVVSTGGIADVPVLVENQVVGESDENGVLLVTGLASYNPVNISISTKTLPIDTNVINDRVQIMAAENHGVDVDFELYQTKAAIIILNDKSGQPIPVGTVASLNGEQGDNFVGWDGELYLEKLQDNNTLILKWDDKQCTLEFPYVKESEDIPIIGPLLCQESATETAFKQSERLNESATPEAININNEGCEAHYVDLKNEEYICEVHLIEAFFEDKFLKEGTITLITHLDQKIKAYADSTVTLPLISSYIFKYPTTLPNPQNIKSGQVLQLDYSDYEHHYYPLPTTCMVNKQLRQSLYSTHKSDRLVYIMTRGESV
ncbi:fimbria/pilus outer membrane usher protein [Pseudoalteromonas sp.]|uniref:fimbria/pilus outer membrane usher protein n=1 Tax=Pseudoalteromonas sp. TaxID=53249 RepID=UPI001BD180B5|nr:fimbria/pilus outer membrane usher protein [Pseudoalteromonas sp.]